MNRHVRARIAAASCALTLATASMPAHAHPTRVWQQRPKQAELVRWPGENGIRAAATDLYVSADGSDSNAGTRDAPLMTILAASRTASPGTTVHVAPGAYQGGFTTTASGTASARIRYVSDVPHGAKIVATPGAAENRVGYWWNAGDYVEIAGFEIDGSQSTDPSWRIGIYGSGSHTWVRGNSVHDILTDPNAYSHAAATGNGGSGICMDTFNGGVDASVTANLVYNIGPTGSAHIPPGVHGIYQIASGDVVNNIVYSVVGVGVTTWHGAKNINIINNTVDHTHIGGIFVGSGDDGADTTTGDYITVANNIVTNSPIGIWEGGTTGVHNRYVTNLLFGNGTDVRLQYGRAIGIIAADPRFVNPSSRDYRLQVSSPAIDAGTSDGAPPIDFSGSTRPQGFGHDIGAYEFVPQR